MAALVKEYLHDFVHGRLDIDTRVTLAHSIEQLYQSGTLKYNDILMLAKYLSGFSAEEIAIQMFVSTELVTSNLARICIAIEYQSGNLDALFLRKLAAKYTPRQINQAKAYLEKHSKDFTYAP